MINVVMLVIFFYAGFALGAWVNRKPPVIKGARIEANLVIDPAVLKQLNGAMVERWLDERGLTWQPKGAVFDLKRGVKK